MMIRYHRGNAELCYTSSPAGRRKRKCSAAGDYFRNPTSDRGSARARGGTWQQINFLWENLPEITGDDSGGPATESTTSVLSTNWMFLFFRSAGAERSAFWKL